MKVVRNSLIPFKGFSAINLFGILFVREDTEINEYLINHEEIHTEQMKELGYLSFYILYFFEWLYRLVQYKFDSNEAYRNISFEREAYRNDRDLAYLEKRRAYAMWSFYG